MKRDEFESRVRSRLAPVLVVPLAAALSLGACKDVSTGPSGTGSIEGRVLSDASGQGVTGAVITTNPASSAPVTDASGRFTIQDVDVGEYTVTARKPGFETGSVSIAVREDETTTATILLESEESASGLEAEITNFRNDRVSEDSVFAEVAYRVVNTDEVTISEYEIVFDVFTTSAVFKQEEVGSDLRPDEQDIGEFRKFVEGELADSVVIADVFTRTGEG